MKNKIFVVSRQAFKEKLKTFSNEDFESTGFISIHSPKIGIHFNDTEKILNDGPNVLNLWFHDADPTEEDLLIGTYREPIIYFNELMAKKISQFVNNNQDKKYWLIHCTAGVCRSGAVGEVLNDFFGNDYFEFKRNNPQIKPNIHVKNLLKNELRKFTNY